MDFCLTCAEPLLTVCIGHCNHKVVCGPCAIKMRQLHNNFFCCCCKQNLDTVVVTNDLQAFYDDYEIWGTVCAKNLPFSEAAGAFFEDASLWSTLKRKTSFSCPHCPSALSNEKDYFHHLRQKHQLQRCEACCESSSQFVQDQMLFSFESLKTHQAEAHVSCDLCPRIFSDKDAAWTHMNRDHLSCHLCPPRVTDGAIRFFASPFGLEEHIKTDHFRCPHVGCFHGSGGEAFATQIDLATHLQRQHQAFSSGSRACVAKFTLHSQSVKSASRNLSSKLRSVVIPRPDFLPHMHVEPLPTTASFPSLVSPQYLPPRGDGYRKRLGVGATLSASALDFPTLGKKSSSSSPDASSTWPAAWTTKKKKSGVR